MSSINECPDSTEYQATGNAGCTPDLTVATKIFLFKTGINFATLTLAETESGWDTLIQSEDIIPISLLAQVDNSDKEEEIWEGNTGQYQKQADGVPKNTYNLITTPAEHARLRTYDGFKGGYVVVDKNTNARMYTDDGTTVDPITIGVMSVGIHTSANDGTPAFTPITISDKYPREWNNTPVSFKTDWMLGKNGLLPARLEVVGANDTTIVVNVTEYETGSAISGLETATDWILTTSQTITTAVESLTILGQYTLSGTGLITGTLNLAAPSALGVDGYKSVGTVVITIT